jgi:hypothetical protein
LQRGIAASGWPVCSESSAASAPIDEGFGRVAVYQLPTYAPVLENGVKCPPKPDALLLGGDEIPDDRFLGLYTGGYAVGNQLFADDWGSRILVWND